jgi:DNA repair exonuclease SbcCD ATPase subunit
MPEWTKAWEALAAGLVTGSFSAASTLWAMLYSFRERITAVETKLGKPSGPIEAASGFHLAIERLQEAIKRLDDSFRDFKTTEHDRLLKEVQDALEKFSRDFRDEYDLGPRRASWTNEVDDNRLDSRFKAFSDKLQALQAALDHLAEKRDTGVTRSEFEADSKRRAHELATIKESLASTNGLLRGTMAAVGILDTTDGSGRRR